MSRRQSHNQRRFRERNWKAFKCIYCSDPVEDKMYAACRRCRRRQRNREMWRRHFMKDFT